MYLGTNYNIKTKKKQNISNNKKYTNWWPNAGLYISGDLMLVPGLYIYIYIYILYINFLLKII